MPSEGLTNRRWLSDIQYPAELARQFVAGIDYETFRDDLMRFHAVTRCLEIIPEASRRLPDEMKAPILRSPGKRWPRRATSIAMITRMSPRPMYV
jgi:uncharacterized protein with HEPN domain